MSQHEQWQLSGNAAEMYERYVVPYLLGPWAPGLVERAALQPGDCVLDVACGTGVVARLAAQKVGTTGRVTGLDLNPGMLAVARALRPLPGAPITWVECSAVAMQLAHATFDVVLCQQGLQFFPDRSAALREMHRVLRPGGRLVLSVWKKASPYTTAMREVVERHIGPEAAARLSATTGLGDAEALHRLLVDAGFSDVHIRPSVMTIHVPPVRRAQRGGTDGPGPGFPEGVAVVHRWGGCRVSQRSQLCDSTYVTSGALEREAVLICSPSRA